MGARLSQAKAIILHWCCCTPGLRKLKQHHTLASFVGKFIFFPISYLMSWANYLKILKVENLFRLGCYIWLYTFTSFKKHVMVSQGFFSSAPTAHSLLPHVSIIQLIFQLYSSWLYVPCASTNNPVYNWTYNHCTCEPFIKPQEQIPCSNSESTCQDLNWGPLELDSSPLPTHPCSY